MRRSQLTASSSSAAILFEQSKHAPEMVNAAWGYQQPISEPNVLDLEKARRDANLSKTRATLADAPVEGAKSTA
ncbi:MAG: hypothetical protein VW804_00090 [Verrucomicrobiota bacterium]